MQNAVDRVLKERPESRGDRADRSAYTKARDATRSARSITHPSAPLVIDLGGGRGLRGENQKSTLLLTRPCNLTVFLHFLLYKWLLLTQTGLGGKIGSAIGRLVPKYGRKCVLPHSRFESL